MAEENQAQEKQFSIQKIYTKDVSFESPASPKLFTEKWEPAVDFNLATNATPLEDSMFEVSITVTVTVKTGETVAYLVEATQAGIFSLAGFTDAEMGPMVGSFCPNILFPYVREVVSDLVAKGGFPQLLLAPVNFDALYAQHLQQAQQAEGSKTLN
ncbi:protein-export chaperone SecB [methanotrophic endosymbiont of Bathymodiolus puteoserpentis (Logatchev)]|jgi:preprotein translocase subunit SecB|uniref:protein-export chaperone SecB n=1 Tax=methanotrophic endosymbiont of Bathymodiolus puteoserpentis (Logatchev) TaxID=343235 RepID=UPI00086E7FD8|nr:protein-export chaperone SecB [methanotrophic endosymbiont of Bathymodiolus puteoserpentis (Logatchev)]SCN47399.1 Protein export cytoplasm chaperone protein (SecB, maintains protein to be exported in unfolded state) [methanotrophic endosymbiont of Bathymodiolus azoricus (Menez Gwen)]SHE20281.1 Protein export cytoplasm chaperone protein (SecB, maintains protein to be exported in unfolded state) [methanotrophic endosymbiont of Bathymodiolus puteoserpentis (Logatchev)]